MSFSDQIYVTTKSDFKKEVELTRFTVCDSVVIFHGIGWFIRNNKKVYFENIGTAVLPDNYADDQDIKLDFMWIDSSLSKGTEVSWNHKMAVEVSGDGRTIKKINDSRHNKSNSTYKDVTSMFHIGNWEIPFPYDKSLLKKEFDDINHHLVKNI